MHTIAKMILLYLTVSLMTLTGCDRSDHLPDLRAIDNVAQMKRTFYAYLLPIVGEQNARILQQRETLLELDEKLKAEGQLGWLDRRTLKSLADEYEVPWAADDVADIVDQLWLRIDIIPPELALAQAAKESGWGRSRFAVEINNLFGQWCYSPGCGEIPQRRAPGNRHEVAAFDSVSESIRRYMNNLNSHERYQLLRQLRADRRRRNQPVTGPALAPGLNGYSQRGAVYVEEILTMMRQNDALLSTIERG